MRNVRIYRAVLGTMILLALFAVSVTEAQAHTPTPSVSAAPQNPDNTVTEMPPEHMPLMSDFANYHPLIVHFPIVLLIFAGVFQSLSFFVYRKELSFAALILILIGVVSVWLASNVFHAHPKDLSERASAMYETHELMAQYTFWLSLFALLAKIVSHFFTSRKWWSEAIVLVCLLGASITVSIAGHHGAQLVHIEGVGPQGKYLEQQH